MTQIVYSSDGKLQIGFRPLIQQKKKDAALEFNHLVTNGKNPVWSEYFEYVSTPQGNIILDTPQNRQMVANKNYSMVVNSILRKDEWEELDRAIVEAVMNELNAVDHLRGAGLTQQLGGLGTMASQFNVGSEKVQPSVTMSGRASAEQDREEKKLRSVPVPIIRQDYSIGIRELDASRRLGNGLDVTEATSSGKAVAEHIERMLFNGDSSIVLEGAGIKGITNQTGIDTDTAANYGGGDWATAGNPKNTVIGMMSALAAKNYRGPFRVYVANTQYFQSLESFANKAGTNLEEVESLPQIQGVHRSDFLSDGQVAVVQMTRNVLDLAIALETTNREWRSGDQMEFKGAVMASITPRVKQDFSGNVGIALATGA